MGHIIGIDVGSQSVKGILCAPDGQPMRTAAHPCSMVHTDSGWSDQDPGEWRRGIAAVVRDLLRSLRRAQDSRRW